MPQSGYSTAYSSLNPLLCKGELKTKHVLDIILYFYSKRTNCVYSCNQSAVFVTFNTMKTESCPSMQLPYIKTSDQHFLTHVYVHGFRILCICVTYWSWHNICTINMWLQNPAGFSGLVTIYFSRCLQITN